MNGKDPGRLEVICGPMFSGKTAELIRRLGQSPGHAIAIKPDLDTRYHETALATHDGKRLPATAVASADQITAAAGSATVIGIDEAHFFGAALLPVCMSLVNTGRRVIVVGVERDHRGQPFEPFPRLLCEADEVLKLSGPCAVCGRPAIHSQRMTDQPGRVIVGGAEMYQARCRACFKPGA